MIEITFKNMRSSADSAIQSRVAIHFPIPPFAANLVHLASSPASMATSKFENVMEPVEEREKERVSVMLFSEAKAKLRLDYHVSVISF
jgi:hypothetical protein